MALCYCAIDSATPLQAKIIAFAALAYFISPLDGIPDGIPYPGEIDDWVVVLMAMAKWHGEITNEHRRMAREDGRIEPHIVKTDGMAFKKEMIDLQFR
ncbi:hypothetical protein GCM10025857_31900 [Alicyclobacillus contaminans]|uniref:YkvA family protein n=1 Tax=Alicyclobacillus contaminans TaxID=392016 RepID=UPI000688D1E5|nr:DUF1232 domain-containing protein [Alicyclobacillus contaminans]GMA51833.1 hypothetical protein GCM10025857_31900 [Alicyclobacillus contaminans]